MRERYEHAQAALSEGLCPECGGPMDPVKVKVEAASNPDVRELARLECGRCDTEWTPMGHLAGEDDPRWVRFAPRTSTLFGQ